MASSSQNTSVNANTQNEPATVPTTNGPAPSQSKPQPNNFEPLDKSSSNTLKRNPKMELNKTDLLKLLGYLEGELQARDIVIAALKSEKMKHLVSTRYRLGTSDPHAALARDDALASGGMGSSSNQVDPQIASLEALVLQQRRMQVRMAKVLKDAEIRHRAVIKELEEEKRKHEHDTAQGDDITYGLEKERTRLKKELEMEKDDIKRLEAELKKTNEVLEEERNRQKNIVLLLLAERKKIIMKYIEERKRSEDLAQILFEEKVRVDCMAEGLEEESKKSLKMEAELEKQIAQFDIERQQYRQTIEKEEKKVKDLEAELEKLKLEMETWKESQARGPLRAGVVGATPPPPPAKPANLTTLPALKPTSAPQSILGTGTPMVSSKVVQPTATVSSVPVSGPTTGIARSVTPGQALRSTAYTPPTPASTGETTTTSDAQATLKRSPAVNPAVSKAAPVQDKLPFNVSLATTGAPASGILSTIKKLPLARGVPPPVPPNKPVVPPKKDGAFVRKQAETIQQFSQEAANKYKFYPAKGGSAAAPSTTAVPPSNSTEDEGKPR